MREHPFRVKGYYLLFLLLFSSIFSVHAQEEAAAATAKANNPLTDAIAFNIQNSYSPTLNQLPDGHTNFLSGELHLQEMMSVMM